MADVRPASGLPAAPVRPLQPARAEAIRAAQRAFFDQALAAETLAAPRPTAGPAPTGAASPSSGVNAFDPNAPKPAASLRPGSLLDIKV